MIRKLKTERDNQQWMLDLALNMRGRARNFEGDSAEVPKRARNTRMIPKVWREEAERQEKLAKRAHARGNKVTASMHYDKAVEAYRQAQFGIFIDDHSYKLKLCAKLDEMVDRRAEVASYPMERVEVPFDDGKTISCLLHLLPDRRKAPIVLHLPGMDSTKEAFPTTSNVHFGHARGFHVITMDGPGQGASAIRKIRAVGDNYERAGAAVIGYLGGRKEIDATKIAAYGSSMGSYWALRLANYDRRIAAVVGSVACFNPNNTIFTECPPRYKQAFMFMAGYDDEDKFDAEVARGMTTRGHLDAIKCPTLLATGEFDPLCPLEDALEAFEALKCSKEIWIFENQYHQLWGLTNLGGLDSYGYIFDWLNNAMVSKTLPADHRRMAYIRESGDGPWGDCEWTPTVKPGEAYF